MNELDDDVLDIMSYLAYYDETGQFDEVLRLIDDNLDKFNDELIECTIMAIPLDCSVVSSSKTIKQFIDKAINATLSLRASMRLGAIMHMNKKTDGLCL